MDAGYVAAHAEEDVGHWWFVGRRAVIVGEMARWLPRRPLRVAEIGCGSGGLLTALARFGTVLGVETDPTLRAAARARGLDVAAGALPDDLPVAPGSLDAVGLFDVLEHLDREHDALAALRETLRPGGYLFVTVPAHPWLWSAHDDRLGHRRRYTRATLRAALAGAGFAVARLTAFNALLAQPIVAVRLAGRLLGRDEHDLARPPAPVNRLLAACFAAEARWLRRAGLPFGISLLAVARRA